MSRPAEDLFPAGYQFFNDSGDVLNAGYLMVYVNDQAYTTQQTVYKDASKATQWTQPIILGSDGRLSSPVKSDTRVDIKIFDSLDNLIDTHNNAGTSWSAVGTDLNENLISNWSFEVAGTGGEPFANWTNSGNADITRDTTDSIHGAACALFTDAANGGDILRTDAFEVTPLRKIEIEFLIKCSNAAAQPAILIRWETAAQAVISSEYVYKENYGLAPTDWTLKEGYFAIPPATARYASIRIFGNEAATPYTVRFDQIWVRDKSPLLGGIVTQFPIGLNLSIDPGDTDHDINVTAGSVLSSTFTEEIVLQTEITKQIDASWATGDDAGGLFAGSTLTANGRLGVYQIKNSTTGQVDVGFDDDPALSPSLPSGFDAYRYLGTVVLDSASNIVDARWYGAEIILLGDPDAEIEDSTISDAALETATINAPPEAEIKYLARCEISGGTVDEFIIQVRPNDASWAQNKFGVGMESSADTLDENWIEGYVRVDGGSQIEYGVDFANIGAGTATFFLYLIGWTDYRRNNP